MTAAIVFQKAPARVECTRVVLRERLGEAGTFEVTAVAPEPLDRADIVGASCEIAFQTRSGERAVFGIVMSAAAQMTTKAKDKRDVRFTIRSAFALLELRRRTRVFQHLSVADIVRRVLSDGYDADDLVFHLVGEQPKREYVVQYDETDASFVRRICEDEGLYFRFELHDGHERFILENTSSRAPAGAEETLLVAERGGTVSTELVAYDCRETRARRPGKVTLRAYDPDKPSVRLEGVAKGGTSVEQGVEVYDAPGGFLTPGDGKKRAELRLEAARVGASTLTFHTNAIGLAPGTQIELEMSPDYHGTARPSGKYFVVAVTNTFTFPSDQHDVEVEAIPLDVPFRLPRTTPPPKALGVHSAIVTGPPGAEIHTDDRGRVHLHFPWDREGPLDATSSLPVRVMQPSMPGSMLIPRVGWEVWVMFEDGDPERPYVIGRTYNANDPPPMSLPANKTMTSLTTWSSPGKKTRNSITYDDASGRQHMVIFAGFDKTTTIAGDATIQTSKVDNHSVGGTLTRSVGGSEWVSVGQAFFAEVGSQSASVGGVQKILVKGDFTSSVGSEKVIVGAALLEQVGNPVTGAVNLAKAAALEGAGAMGKVGAYVAMGAGLAMGAYDGYKSGGVKGAAQALGMGALGIGAGMVPGGDAVLASVLEAARPAPWHDPPAHAGAAQAGGGAGGDTTDATKAHGPGPGHRDHVVKGALHEMIGALHGIVTPGSIGWKTTGASSFMVGGSHTTKTKSATFKTTGASTETLGALHVKSDASIERVVTGALSTSISGALKSTAGGAHLIKADGALTINIGGSLQIDGTNVTFVCGDAKVSSSPGGVLIEASEVTVTGDSKQSSKTTHL